MSSSALALLTANLARAAEEQDWKQARRLLGVRAGMLRQNFGTPPDEMQAIAARGQEIVNKLRERRDGLAEDIERLKRARGRLSAFRPAHNPRRRLNLEM